MQNEPKTSPKKHQKMHFCAVLMPDFATLEGSAGGGYMNVQVEPRGLKDGCRLERENGSWAAMSTPSSTTPDPALGRRGDRFSRLRVKAWAERFGT